MAVSVRWCTARRAVLGVIGHAFRGILPSSRVPTSRLLWKISLLPAQFFSTQVETEEQNQTVAAKSSATFDTVSRYKEKPWEYLTSEEYIERYGERLVWADYRRNHKGGIPPQKTRKTCIRGDAICGNPCPICRDQKLGLHYQNVKLLEQFISPYTGEILHPTRTGVCMKQHKKLTTVIEQARGFGLLGCRVPFVEFHDEDYTNTHGAVGKTPPAPALQTGTVWYPWYEWQQPLEKEVARVRKIYRRFLKEKPHTSQKDDDAKENLQRCSAISIQYWRNSTFDDWKSMEMAMVHGMDDCLEPMHISCYLSHQFGFVRVGAPLTKFKRYHSFLAEEENC